MGTVRNTMASSEAAKVSLAARALLAFVLPTGPGISPVLTNLARKATPLVSLAGCLWAARSDRTIESYIHFFRFVKSFHLFI
jgi:hypothetical protein